MSEQLGVRLSPEDDPDKAFAPQTSGVVLGVHYDTVSWTWSIPGDPEAGGAGSGGIGSGNDGAE